MSAGSLIIVAAPSGAGKTTLVRMLMAHDPKVRHSVSTTTREPRVGEQEGREYHFVDIANFVAMRDRGEFVEWAEVHGNYYGTALAEIERAKADPACGGIIFDIDYQGARQIRAKIPDITGVFILPPSMPELLRRLRGRASESEDVVQRRFQVAMREIEHYALFDYVIVNDEVDRAFDALRAVILAERSKRARKAAVAESLLRNGHVQGA